MSSWPRPLYEIRLTLQAPLRFAFQWCTDYSPEDPSLEKGTYQRKVVERSPERVVLEDLSRTRTGWEWFRSVVTLQPPNRWHAELRGNVPDWSLDYRLSPIRPDRTLLTIRWHIRRRPYVKGQSNPPKDPTERMMRRLWKNFARALERDYRQTVLRRSPTAI